MSKVLRGDKEPSRTAPFGFLVNHQQYSGRGRECRYYSGNKNRSLRYFNAYKWIEETGRDPSFWQFNYSLLEDDDYIKLVTDRCNIWLEEGKDIQDPTVLWDFTKYKIRYETISYSKQKAKNRKEKLSVLEQKIKKCTVNCDEQPNPANVNELEILQTEYDRQYEYTAQGAIVRSRINLVRTRREKQ